MEEFANNDFWRLLDESYYGMARAGAPLEKTGALPAFLPWAVLGVVLLAGLLAGAWFVFKKRNREKFRLSMEMILLSVRIPPKNAEEIQQSGRQEKIGSA
jgi:hypothetical protein